MTKWEYALVNINYAGRYKLLGLTGDHHNLDEYGLMGWELVSVTWPATGTPKDFPGIAIFKRKLTGKK